MRRCPGQGVVRRGARCLPTQADAPHTPSHSEGQPAGHSVRLPQILHYRAAASAIEGAGSLEQLAGVLTQFAQRRQPLQVVSVAVAMRRLAGVPIPQPLLLYLSAQLADCCQRRPGDVAARTVTNLLYGLQAVEPRGEGTRAMLAAVLPMAELVTMRPRSPPGARHVAGALYGIGRFRQGDAGQGLLDALCQWVTDCGEPFGPQEVSGALSGLHGKTDSPAVRRLLLALVPRVQSCTDVPDSQSIAGAMHGLQRQPGTVAAAAAVDALAALARRAPVLDGDCIGAALVGMSHFDGYEHEGRRLLCVLLPHVTAAATGTAPPMTAQGFANALYGVRIQGLERFHRLEMGEMLQGLAKAARRMEEPLSPLTASLALHGLSRRSAGAAGVDELFEQLAPRVAALSSVRWTPAQAAAGLYGASYQCDSPPVRLILGSIAAGLVLDQRSGDPGPAASHHESVLGALGLKGQGSSPEARAALAAITPLFAAHRSMPIYVVVGGTMGITSMGRTAEQEAFLSVLVPHIRALPSSLGGSYLSYLCSLINSLITMSMSCPVAGSLLQYALQRVPQQVTDQQAPALCQVLSLAGAVVPAALKASAAAIPGTSLSFTERIIVMLLCRCQVPGLFYNVNHHTGFELDIYRPGPPALNVELDSNASWYRTEYKLRRQELRRRVLAQHGMTVERVCTHRRPLLDVVAEIAHYCGANDPGISPEAAYAWTQAHAVASQGWEVARGLACQLRGKHMPQWYYDTRPAPGGRRL